MANPVTDEGPKEQTIAADSGNQSRKEKRKVLKKLKRRQIRTEAAIREREEEVARLNSPEEQLLLRAREQEEAEQAERNRREFEERERIWLEEVAARKAREEEDARRKKVLEEEERKAKIEHAYGLETDDEYDYVEEGPPEIIWQGNEIIIKKKRVKVAKRITESVQDKEDDDRPTSNPLPPQSATFASCTQGEPVTVQEMLDTVAQQVPNFGTEQDKAHCPFHLKTGACRFGSRCSRVHFYPDKSCTLLVKNMYNGPGLTCEQDEGLEYTDEEIERCYEEFYDDVHTEFLKFGEIVNFKVCKNSSYHLRGNLYVHYKSLESAIVAYNTMNARYYAGKQIVCEFAGVTKWKVAICGEFMKSRLKTCSHGSACNFIHCFRNPGGDYEWADWDNPPPRYWVKKMVALFGTSAESSYDKELESDDYNRHREPERMRTSRGYRHQSERSHYSSSDGDEMNSKKSRYSRHFITRERSSKRSRHHVSADENEQLAENRKSEEHVYSRSFYFRTDAAVEGFSKKHYSENLPRNHSRRERRRSEDRSSSRRKRKPCSEERDNSERNGTPKSHKKRDRKHDKKHESADQHFDSSDHWDSFSRHSSGSPNLFDRKYSHERSESEEDFGGARYYYSSHSGERRKYAIAHVRAEDSHRASENYV